MTGLLMVSLVMVVLAVASGVAYAYTQREVSPYAPRVHDFLDETQPKSENNERRRAA